LVVGSLVIELDNIFIQALRLYAQCILRSALQSGAAVLPGYTKGFTDTDFTLIVLQKLNPSKLNSAQRKRQTISRRDEKTIGNPSEWVGFLNLFGLPVPQDFSNAIALNLTFYEEIGVVRNFYAHRSKETLDRIRQKFPQLAYGQALHPDDLVTSTPLGISRAKYPEWSSEGLSFLHVAAGQP
jgi:hypothetical protein